MKKILLTCFKPFGGEKINPSEEAVGLVKAPLGCELKRVCLPVSWREAREHLFDTIDSFSPDVVIMTGQAGGSSSIRVERVAINLCGAIKDEDGFYPGMSKLPAELPIREGAPAAYFSTVDCKRIQKALKEENIPAELSYSAGAYICNCALFSALDKFACEGKNATAGFIHLPYADCQRAGAPTLGVGVMARALETVLAQIIMGEKLCED